METDPVCGMNISEDSEYFTEYAGRTYHFCSENCLKKFLASPNSYLPESTARGEKSGCGCGDKTGHSV